MLPLRQVRSQRATFSEHNFAIHNSGDFAGIWLPGAPDVGSAFHRSKNSLCHQPCDGVREPMPTVDPDLVFSPNE